MDAVQLYLVSPALAERTGFRKQRYITKDGRYIVNDRDLRNIERADGEPVTGNDVKPIAGDEAKRLITENNYKTGNAADKGK